jgi:hypothetical protein
MFMLYVLKFFMIFDFSYAFTRNDRLEARSASDDETTTTTTTERKEALFSLFDTHIIDDNTLTRSVQYSSDLPSIYSGLGLHLTVLRL